MKKELSERRKKMPKVTGTISFIEQKKWQDKTFHEVVVNGQRYSCWQNSFNKKVGDEITFEVTPPKKEGQTPKMLIDGIGGFGGGGGFKREDEDAKAASVCLGYAKDICMVLIAEKAITIAEFPATIAKAHTLFMERYLEGVKYLKAKKGA